MFTFCEDADIHVGDGDADYVRIYSINNQVQYQFFLAGDHIPDFADFEKVKRLRRCKDQPDRAEDDD